MLAKATTGFPATGPSSPMESGVPVPGEVVGGPLNLTGRKQPQEDAIQDINYMAYMNWREWITALSQFNIGVHLMRTHAAGTFAMNCAWHGIPSIGYKGLDTQELCHPLTTVDVGDLDRAVEIGKQLKSNEKFYKLCSETAGRRFQKHYTEKAWLKKWRNTHG